MLHSTADAAAAGQGALRTLTEGAQEVWFRTPPRSGVPSAWYGHVPFALWVVEALRPRVIVELGTHNGVSYAAFCEAVAGLGLDAKCYAVDTWKGDAQAGFYPEQVYEDFRAFHDPRYGAFSSLLRTTFDAAAQEFAPGSIDLLHIDGCHTYDQVKRDFETWRPLLSARAVVLFHDTNVRERDFGVWRLWAELVGDHPAFEFLHCYGLGVLGYGSALEGPVRELCRLDDEAEILTLRTRFAMSGRRCMAEAEQAMLEDALAEHKQRIEIIEAARLGSEREWTEAQSEWNGRLNEALSHGEAARAARDALQKELEAVKLQLDRARIDNVRLREALAGTLERIRASEADLDTTRQVLAANQAHLLDVSQAHAAVLESTLWRALGPLRRAGRVVPGPVRRSLRRVARRVAKPG